MTAAPAHVFSSAEFLCDEMQARDWTTDDVAARMPGNLAKNSIVIALLISVLDGPRIDSELSKALGVAFDVSADYFAKLDKGWHEWPDRRSPFSAPDSVFGPACIKALRLHQNDNVGGQ